MRIDPDGGRDLMAAGSGSTSNYQKGGQQPGGPDILAIPAASAC